MEGLLREIEAQLSAKSEVERAKVVQALRGLVAGVAAVRNHLHLSPAALVRAAGSMATAHATGVTGPKLVERLKAQATRVGPHVAALFSAL